MCYSVAFLANKAAIYEKRYALLGQLALNDAGHTWPSSYFLSGFTHPVLPLVTSSGISFFRWGLIPFWVKDAAQAASLSKHTLNAMGETLFEKPSFRAAAAQHRGILGVTGFFEWREFQGEKYPYFVHAANGELLSLACITSQWQHPDSGEQVYSFGIVTTDANPLLAQIHNTKKRMPLVLTAGQEAEWISDTLSPTAVVGMAKPCETHLLRAYPISRAAGNPKMNRNEAWMLREEHYADLPELVL